MAVSRGRGDLAAQLAKQPPAKKAAILVAILAVLGFFYWQFYYSGMTESRDNEKAVRSRLQAEQQKLDQDVRLMKKLKAEHENLRKGIEAIQLALPSEAELPSFIDHLQVKAGDAGVNFKSWSREREVPIAKYIKVPMKVQVSGNFNQLMHYFHLLGPAQADAEHRKVEEETGIAERRPAERIVTIENLSIGKAVVKNEEVILTADFRASTFRQEEAKRPPPAKKAAESKPKGGKGQVKDAKKKREEDVEKRSGEGAGDRGVKALTKPGSLAPVNPK
jgi:type IV pilus assembly protein PilO